VKKKNFVPWEEKLSGTYKVPIGAPFFKINVPTVDTVSTHAFVAPTYYDGS
jgi:dynein heavy chain